MAAVDSLSFVGGACACGGGGGGGDSSGSSSDGGGGDSQGASGASDATTPPLGFSPTENLKGFSARSTDSGTSSTNTQDVINQVNTIGATPGQALGGVGITQSPPPSVKFFKEHKNKATWENRFAVQFRNFTLWPFRLWPFTIRPFQLLTISTPWLALNLSLTQAEFAKSFQLAKAIQEYGRIGAVTFFTNPNNVSKVQADLGLSRLGSSPGSSGGSSSGQSTGSPGSGSESSGGGTSGG
ncbi:MAG: hypothetical protein O3A85_00960, partial [Proteobacteria bacterium]|nr:hypothetical protein [Pseudomonadota bacterium]